MPASAILTLAVAGTENILGMEPFILRMASQATKMYIYNISVPVGKVCNIKQVLELGLLVQFRNRIEREKCDVTATCMSHC